MIYLLVLFFIFFYFNFYTPVFPGDDYVYSYVFSGNGLFTSLTEESVRLSSWNDIIQSSILHYQVWMGRLTNHFLTLFFLWQDKIWFDLCNSFISVLLLVLVITYANKGMFSLTKTNKKFLVFSFICFWLFQPHWASVFTWLPGSCNYLWTTTFTLLFLLPYYQNYYKNDSECIYHFISKTNYIFLVLFFCFGIIVGCTNETFIGLVILYLCLFLYVAYSQKKLAFWQLFGFIGLLIGYGLLMFSPSIPNRILQEMTAYYTTLSEVDKNTVYPMIESLEQGKSWLSSISIDYLLLNIQKFLNVLICQVFLWEFVLLFVIEYFTSKKLSHKIELQKYLQNISIEDKNMIILLIVGSFLCDVVMIISPCFPLRTAFFSLILLLLTSLILIRNQFHKHVFQFLIVKVICGLLCVVFLVTFASSIIYCPISYHNRMNWIAEVKILDKQQPNQIHEFDLENLPDKSSLLMALSSSHCNYFFLSTDENHWVNRSFKIYHGLSGKVRVKPFKK